MADIGLYGRTRGVRPNQVVVPRAARRAIPIRVVRGDIERSWYASVVLWSLANANGVPLP